MIYIENANTNTSTLSASLEAEFISLLQQGRNISDKPMIKSNQVWSGSDLNPDRITNELKKLFTYNKTETKRHNYSDNYFDYNHAYVQSLSSSGGDGLSILGIGSVGGKGASSSSLAAHLLTTTQSIFSQTEIENFLTQESLRNNSLLKKVMVLSFVQ